MNKSIQWASQLRDEIIQLLKRLGGADWGYNQQENWGFVSDILALADMPEYHKLRMKQRTIDAGGILIDAAVADEVTSFPEIRRAVCNLLSAEGEDLFIVLPFLDQESLRYWFVVGDRGHGHIGEIVIRREDLAHLDLSEEDEL